MRRASSGRLRSIRRATLAFTIAVALATPSPIAAANGPWSEAQVICNPYDDYLAVQARAGSAPGWAEQWIRYRHYLWRYGSGWVALNPPAEGWIHHSTAATEVWTPFGSFFEQAGPDAPGQEWRITPGQSGSYAVYTEYWWWNGTGYEGPLGTWSNWVHYYYQQAPTQTLWCNLDLTPEIIERDCPWCYIDDH
jgi:hypothetical protein